MKRLLAVLLAGVAVFATPAVFPAEPEPKIPRDSKTYGVYPIAYQDIIKKFLEERLLDAGSARIEWGEPRPGQIVTTEKKRVTGYLVLFKVNSRNKFGMYTGKQNYYAMILNGEIIAAGRGSPGQ